MALDIAPLATAVAKLIGLGVAALTAREQAGWGKDEAKLFGDALESIPAFSAALAKGKADECSPLQAYCELLTGAVGDAWRRHWAHNKHLAPTGLKSRVHAWLTSPSERTKQFERALIAGRFEKALTSGTPRAEVELLESLADPIASPWFRALWAAFWAEEEAASDAGSELPPLLVWQKGQEGASRREFERDVRSVFFEGLVADKYRALRTWLLTRPEEQARLVRIMLAVRLSNFRTEHIFGTYEEGSPFARLPLGDIYVEPTARRLQHKPGHLSEVGGKQPVLTLLNELLAQPKVRIIVVLADFGRGKSLTARSLAWRLADRFLDDPRLNSPELAYPMFVRCSAETIKRNALNPDSIVRSATKRQAEQLLPTATVAHDAFGLPQQQSTVVLLDGLDEVQLDAAETLELFAALRDSTNANLRFVVFSRPAAIPQRVCEDTSIHLIALQDFTGDTAVDEAGPAEAEEPTRSQVALWLDRWSKLAAPPHPQVVELKQHGLLELCQTPVLLFMVAQTWTTLAQQSVVKRADVYDEFVALTARSKLQQEQAAHPVVMEAAKVLLEKLRDSRVLPRESTIEHAMVEVLSRIAWCAHCLEQNRPGASFTTFEVKSVLKEDDIDIRDKSLGLVVQGVLLTLNTALGGDDPEVHFAHKSFREFLVAKYWEVRLRRLSSEPRTSPDMKLTAGRLFAAGDQSGALLLELCQRWPSTERKALIGWAQLQFNDETLSTTTSLRDDKRYILREVALMLGSGISDDAGLEAASPFSLSTLCAVSGFCGRPQFIHARGLSHVAARLERANLHSANLRGANLQDANLQRANIHGAHLQGANLQRANLRDANIERAYLQGTNLQGANLQGAHLRDAYLRDANLRDANIERAYLQGTNLQGANLQGANLQRANLRDAHLQGVDLRGAHLQGASLRDANLQGANLRDANLQGANLQGANLQGAQLQGANLQGAQLQGAWYEAETRFPRDFPAAILAGMRRVLAGSRQDKS